MIKLSLEEIATRAKTLQLNAVWSEDRKAITVSLNPWTSVSHTWRQTETGEIVWAKEPKSESLCPIVYPIEGSVAPCPFCGGSAHVTIVATHAWTDDYKTFCDDCSASGPMSTSPEEALADWNRRK